MKAPIIIWRKSIYENDFKCNSCGMDLMKDGELNQTILSDREGKYLFCPRCKNMIAMTKGEMEVPDDSECMLLKGKWNGS